MDSVALGRRIRESRKKLNMTQDQLSEKVDITPFYMGEIERGVKTPSLDVFVKIVQVLDVPSDYLLRGQVETASVYVDSDISKKISHLTAKQKLAVEAIIDAYIKFLN